MTVSISADNAAHFLSELNTLGFIRAIDAVPAQMTELRASGALSVNDIRVSMGTEPMGLGAPTMVATNELVQEAQPTAIVVEQEGAPAPAPETAEQKRKRRGKAEMEAARVFEAFLAEDAVAAGVVLGKFGIDDVADIGPDRAAALVAAIEEAKKPVETAQTQAAPTEADDLMGDLGETTAEAPPPVEPWMLFGADGTRYDACSSPEEWCESLAALIASADTAAEIKALATVNAGIKDRMESAGKIDLLRDVIDGGRTRMAALEAKPAGDAPTVQDCAAALRAYLDPNRASNLTSDERTSKASEILKVQFGAPKVASLKPEQFAAFIATLASAE